MDNPTCTLHFCLTCKCSLVPGRFSQRQTDNYPPDVAALSKKMVQATLEIYKNTLWGSDVEIEIYTVAILWKQIEHRHSSEWMCMVAWHLRLVDLAVNN